MLSVTLTLNPWPWKCHQCHMHLVMRNCDKFYQNMSTHFGDKWENASQSAYLTICATLIFDLLISKSKSNQFTFLPTCTEVVNFVKFAKVVRYHVNKLFSMWSLKHVRRHAWRVPKKECLRHRSNSGRGIKTTNRWAHTSSVTTVSVL